MENIGEHIVGQYLQLEKNCDFVQYNLQTEKTQGEIDVVAISLTEKTVYICEVATHLETGLQYTKNNQPDNVNRFVNKFKKNIEYAKKFPDDYQCHFMLWTPIIKIPKNNKAKNNQYRDLQEIQSKFKKEKDVEIELIYNQDYLKVLNTLRAHAKNTTSAMSSSVMRFLQIEEKLKAHIEKIES